MTDEQKKLKEKLELLNPIELTQVKMLYSIKQTTPQEIAESITDPKRIQGMINLVNKQKNITD